MPKNYTTTMVADIRLMHGKVRNIVLMQKHGLTKGQFNYILYNMLHYRKSKFKKTAENKQRPPAVYSNKQVHEYSND